MVRDSNWLEWDGFRIRQPRDYSGIATILINDGSIEFEELVFCDSVLDLLSGWVLIAKEADSAYPLASVLQRLGVSEQSTLVIASTAQAAKRFYTHRLFGVVLTDGDPSGSETLNWAAEVLWLDKLVKLPECTRHFRELDRKSARMSLVRQLAGWEKACLAGGSLHTLFSRFLADFGKRPSPEFLASHTSTAAINVEGDVFLEIREGLVGIGGSFIRHKTAEKEPSLHMEIEDDNDDPLTLQFPLDIVRVAPADMYSLPSASFMTYYSPCWSIKLGADVEAISLTDLSPGETYRLRILDESGEPLGTKLTINGESTFATDDNVVFVKVLGDSFYLTTEERV